MRRWLVALSLLTLAAPALADDVWTTPYPGVRLLRRTTAQPVVMWAAVIDSCAPGVRFRATAPSEGPRTTSSFGRLMGAQLAINGDFFDHDFGLNLGNGMAWPYPDTDHSGNLSIGPNRIEMTPDYVVLPAPAPWVTEQLGGRWTLLDDGVPQLGIDDNGPASGGFVCAPGLRHPRTAVGLSRDRRQVILLVADGRSSASLGMTCDEMIAVFQELGAHDAMGLDGGGSSTLWSGGAIVNHPSDATGERTVRNHLAVFATGAGASPHCGLRSVVTEAPMAAFMPDAALPAVAPQGPPSRFTARTPTRLFDTRGPETSARLVRSDGSSAGPLSLTASGAFRAWSDVGVPSNATAVWLNLTAVGLLTPGYVTVFPHGRPRPETSNVNYEPSRAVANATPVALGASSQVDFEAHSAVEVIADLAGFFSPTGAGLSPITPTRVLDTRSLTMPLRAGVPRSVDVRAPADAVAVVSSVAVIARGAPGFLTASPCGAPVPTTSNVNFGGADVIANAVVSGLGGGRMCLTSNVDVDAVIDVTGYLTPAASLSYVPLFPQRILDTRATPGRYVGRVAARQVLELPIQRLAGMPAAVGAVVANLTVVDADSAGFVTAYPCGTPAPEASTLNFAPGRAVGGLTVSAVGTGSLCLFASARAHVLVDVLGVWVTPTTTPDAGAPRDATAPDATALDATALDAPSLDVAPIDRPVISDARDVAFAPDTTQPDVTAASDVANDAADPSPPDTLEGACRCHAGTARPGASPWALGLVWALARTRRRRARTRAAMDTRRPPWHRSAPLA